MHLNTNKSEPGVVDILAELMARYETLAASIAVVQAPVVMEDQSCSFYPAELASV